MFRQFESNLNSKIPIIVQASARLRYNFDNFASIYEFICDLTEVLSEGFPIISPTTSGIIIESAVESLEDNSFFFFHFLFSVSFENIIPVKHFPSTSSSGILHSHPHFPRFNHRVFKIF